MNRHSRHYAAIATRITLSKNGVNGGVNEAGIRRVKSIIKTGRKLGWNVQFGAGDDWAAVNAMSAESVIRLFS